MERRISNVTTKADNQIASSLDNSQSLKEALDISTSPYIIHGRNEELIYANNAARNAWPLLVSGLEAGKSRIDAVRDQVSSVAPHLSEEALERHVQKTLDIIHSPSPEDLFATNNRWFRTTHYKLDNGSIAGVAIDITEHLTLEKQLEKVGRDAQAAIKAKAEFLANMSHEIRTPMNGILGMAEILKTKIKDAETLEIISIMERSGEALLDLINGILDFSKLEADKITLEALPFSLKDCVSDVAALMSQKSRSKGLDLVVDIDKNLPENFIGDETRIRQIILNLLGNAIKFTHSGQINLSVRGQIIDGGFNISIAIQDTGIGIEHDKIDTVFQKFVQADNSTTRKYGGTGLGLSISKSLAELMEGDISLKSTPGVGSTFTLSIPLPLAERMSQNSITEPSKLSGNYLVFDFDNTLYEVLKPLFDKDKTRLLQVRTPEKAQASLNYIKMKSPHFDAIILKSASWDTSLRHNILEISQNIKIVEILEASVKPDNSISSNERIHRVHQSDIGSKLGAVLEDRLDLQQKQFASLPSERSNENAAISIIKNSPTDISEKVDVLIAEDNEVNQVYLQYLVEDAGLTYKFVENGLLAVEAWKNVNPDFILMDISMPEMNGLQATKAIRTIEQKDRRTQVPIIAITAHAMQGDKEEFLKAGMDDYISKPISKAKFIEKISQWRDGTVLKQRKTA